MALGHPGLTFSRRARSLRAAAPGLLAAVLAMLLSSAPAAAQTLSIRADSYPVAYFAGRIAGPAATVVVPVPADEAPEHWSPSAEEIAAFQAADVVLLNGAGLAQWTATATLSRGKLLDASQGFADQFIAAEGVTHSHGPEGEHTHGATASFTWLDFALARAEARAVADGLVRRLPAEAAALEANWRALDADLAALDAAALDIGALAAGRPLLASHPVYQYLERRYGLDLPSMEWEPDQTPTAGQVAALDALLTAHPARLMIWEGTPTPETAALLAQRGIATVVFETAVNTPAGGDFLSIMQANLARLRAALAGA